MQENSALVGGILYVCDDLPSWIIYLSFRCPLELKKEIDSLILSRSHPDSLLLKVGTAVRKHSAWLKLFGF
jgi:hypothetical protein